ncbi:MAG: hypothetical protein H5T45_05170 [Thermoplasmatales archaeon]|nr:hypothetical protein [Thermoplasmatales archaeon]
MKFGINAKKIFAILGVFVILVTIFALIFFREEKKGEEEKEFILDDRVSPYVNQGLFVEILRVRNRDILNRMLSFGENWREKPRFYYIVEVDGKVCSNKGNCGESDLYETWDTFGKESMFTFDIEEEQKTSRVTIKIVEENKKGISLRTNDVEKETLTVIYDYRTGRWSGDDNFGDKDGYGYYLGENYEIWFNVYQSDYDNDEIPYWIEVNVLGTDPTVNDCLLDPDGDGIPTCWEWKWGYDPFTQNDHSNLDPDIDGISNLEEYKMRKWFANPFQPDIYIEVDFTEKNKIIEIEPTLYEESKQMLIERFAQHGIKVFIDDGWSDSPPNGGGEILPHASYFDDVLGKQLLQYYTHHFSDERKGIFRYLVISSCSGGFTSPVYFNKFDAMMVGNNLKDVLFTRLAFSPKSVRVVLAAAVMHELGHTLGLVPAIFPGNDIMPRYIGDRYPNMSDEDYNGYVKNYVSIMNYRYIYKKDLFDYSDGSHHQKYDMDDWGHIYLPTFEIDIPIYEDVSIKTFEDFKIVDEYPGIVLKGWKFDENLTKQNLEKIKKFVTVKNADADIQIFIKNNSSSGKEYNLRVYAKPKVEPVFAIYSLVAEGYVKDNNFELYSLDELIKYAKSFIE